MTLKGGKSAVTAPIHVTLAVYDPEGTYSRHAGVFMASIFEHTRSLVCVHILHDHTLTGENRDKFLRTASKYGQDVLFSDVDPLLQKVGDDAIRLVDNAFSRGSLFRLFIPDLLDLDKVIYLDSDTLVNLDIQELWNVDLEGHCLGAARDHSETRSKRLFTHEAVRMRLMGCRLRDYVNSGVLLMDLSRIRSRGDILESCSRWFFRHRHHSSLPDQDFLNSFFRGSIKLIPNRFNEREPDHHGKDVILHAVREHKPWLGLKGSPTERLYWKTFLRTAWGEDKSPDELVDILSGIASWSPFAHRHTKQCYRQIGLRLWRDVFCNNLLSILGLLAGEAFHRSLEALRPSRRGDASTERTR